MKKLFFINIKYSKILNLKLIPFKNKFLRFLFFYLEEFIQSWMIDYIFIRRQNNIYY